MNPRWLGEERIMSNKLICVNLILERIDAEAQQFF